MKFKLVLVGEFWQKEASEPLKRALNSLELNARLANIFYKNIPGTRLMGGAGLYRQQDDYGIALGGGCQTGIAICLSQAFDRPDRNWRAFADEVFDLCEVIVRTHFCEGSGAIELFLEAHLSSPAGESRFLERGPVIINPDFGLVRAPL